jgi:ribosomal protein S18 acetylase RimI-like enzyme
MSFLLRDATPADFGAIADITHAAYSEYGRIMAPAAWAGLREAVAAALITAEDVQRIVAVDGDRVIGSVMLFAPSSDAYQGAASQATWPELRLLAVAEEARGRGVGRALVQECMKRALAMGASEIGLHTSQSMQVATKLYTDLGFERVPEFDFQPPGAELVKAYRLSLAQSP